MTKTRENSFEKKACYRGGICLSKPWFLWHFIFRHWDDSWWLWSKKVPGWKRKLSCWRCHPCKLDTRVCVVWCLFLWNFQCSEKGPIKNLLSWHVRSRPPQLHYNAKPKPIKTHGYLYTYMENLGGQLYGWETHSYGSKSRKAVASANPGRRMYVYVWLAELCRTASALPASSACQQRAWLLCYNVFYIMYD